MNELPTPTLPLSPVSLPRGALHRPSHRAPAERCDGGGILVSWARHLDEVRQAQRLRYQIFCGEMGARLHSRVPGHDVDLFDEYCEHLLVREAASGEVIGTYRVLTPAQPIMVSRRLRCMNSASAPHSARITPPCRCSACTQLRPSSTMRSRQARSRHRSNSVSL